MKTSLNFNLTSYVCKLGGLEWQSKIFFNVLLFNFLSKVTGGGGQQD